MRIRQMRRNNKLMGKILIENGAINEEQFDKGLAIHRERNSDTPIG